MTNKIRIDLEGNVTEIKTPKQPTNKLLVIGVAVCIVFVVALFTWLI